MSLTGSLEDLPLLDIIQIVSFSKKTGYLTIRVESGDGAIVFKDGLIVAAYSWDSLPLDPRAAHLPEAARNELVRARIEIGLEQLVRLRDGTFNFSLTEDIPTVIGERPVARETLTAGINPQEVLLDLARGMDEDRRDSSAAIEASFQQPPEPDEPLGVVETAAPEADEEAAEVEVEPPAAAPEEEPAEPPPLPASEAAEPPRHVLLVDDEDDVRQLLALRFAEAGYNVDEAEGPDEAVRAASRLAKAGLRYILVTDLGMPSSGGASFQGGFEVVKRLWKMNQRPPVLIMTEILSPAVRARARQMSVSHLVFKPGLSKLDPEQFESDLNAFARRLVYEILPRAVSPSGPRPARPRPAAAPGTTPVDDELSRQFRVLHQRLEDLRRSGDAARIAVLIMKVAREFFERALLMLVKGEELRGLGGFGPAPKNANLNLLAREIVVPLGEPSVFQEVVASRQPWNGSLDEAKGGSYLVGRVGRFKGTQAALIPLLTHRETTAVLFGDNPETGRPLERLEALEVFFDQAGMALENVFLQRKIQAMQA